MKSRRVGVALIGSAVLVLAVAMAPLAAAIPSIPKGYLPNASKTPGATSSAVTQANIQKTICVAGYSAKVRPPASYTTALKKKQLAAGYNYKGITKTSYYEEDHLISLELGGAPKDPKNLWPEPYNGTYGAHTKDKVENRLHSLVCSGDMTLRTAQRLIAKNWWAAYEQYVAVQQ